MGMDKQVSLSGLSDELAQVRTKKKEFLSQIERIVPWGEWLTLIRPCYYKGERGNKPYDLERILVLFVPFSICILYKTTNEFRRLSSIIRTPLRHSIHLSGIPHDGKRVMTGERLPSALQSVFRYPFPSAF